MLEDIAFCNRRKRPFSRTSWDQAGKIEFGRSRHGQEGQDRPPIIPNVDRRVPVPPRRLQARVSNRSRKNQRYEPSDSWTRKSSQERMAKLAAGVAQIDVGAATETEMIRKGKAPRRGRVFDLRPRRRRACVLARDGPLRDRVQALALQDVDAESSPSLAGFRCPSAFCQARSEFTAATGHRQERRPRSRRAWRCNASSTAGFPFLHFCFGRRTDVNLGHAGGQFGHAFPWSFSFVIVAWSLTLISFLDLFDTRLYRLGGTGTLDQRGNYRRSILPFLAVPRSAKLDAFQDLIPKVSPKWPCRRSEWRCLPAMARRLSPKPGALNRAATLDNPANLVDTTNCWHSAFRLQCPRR